MAYREDLNCQECLKRKVKSPMSRATKNWLTFAGFVVLLAAEASVLGSLDNHSPGYIMAPVVVISLASFVAGLAKFIVEMNKEAA